MEEAAKKVLNEHLPYELDMLRVTYNFIHSPEFAEQRAPDFLRYAAMVSFWTHARSLNEFFTRVRNKTFESVCSARDFTDGKATFRLHLDELDEKMNIQISHLQYERPTASLEKLGGYDMLRVVQTIERAVQEFERHMTPEARQHWTPRPLKRDYQIEVGGASACAAFGTTTSSRSIQYVFTGTGPVQSPTRGKDKL